MQFHFDGQSMPDWGSIIQNVKRFRDLGLQVQITELDVRILTPATEAALGQQARIFGEALRMALTFPNPKTCVMWGLTDGHSWIPNTFPGYGAALILDESFEPKLAYAAIRDVLSKPSPDPSHFDRYLVKAGKGRALPAFRAVKTSRAPVLDGKVSPGEWDRAIAYPYLYNQLNSADLRTPSQSDLRGKWRLLARGDTLYGLVHRIDDVTSVTSPNPWDNDTVEIFFSIDGVWKQYRTLVGQDWQKDNDVPGKAVWSKDGSVLEFSVKLPKDLTGLTIGWSTALADNDTPGEGTRERQLYPVIGNNNGWQGRGFAELTIEDAKGRFVDGQPVGDVPPFVAAHVDDDRLPKIDGDDGDDCWKDTPIYSFGYDHLSPTDQSPPDQKTLAGDWRVMVNGKSVYGLLHRADDKTVTTSPDPRKNDHVEILFDLGGQPISLVTAVGRNFAKSDAKRTAKAVWSRDGKVLEFFFQASDAELAGQQARWSIGLFDNDRGKAGPQRALFPFCGHGMAAERAGETGQLQLQ
jgi:endo-1,4-beta-xylanase